jgi:hypothetical protein
MIPAAKKNPAGKRDFYDGWVSKYRETFISLPQY